MHMVRGWRTAATRALKKSAGRSGAASNRASILGILATMRWTSATVVIALFAYGCSDDSSSSGGGAGAGGSDAGTDASAGAAGKAAGGAGTGAGGGGTGGAGAGGTAGTGTGGAATGGSGGGTLITPDDPGPADVSFTMSSGIQKPISRFIYGTNQPDWSGRGKHLTLGRKGGNRWTAYNWENNASNAGSDWQHQNDAYLGGGDLPAEAVAQDVATMHAAGAAALVTVPIQGYVAADKNGDGDVNQTANYLSVRFRQSKPFKGSGLSTTPDVSDGFVYQDEFVNALELKFKASQTDPNKAIFYSMDNEPDLWSETHARIHPGKVGYAELVSDNTEYAKAVKSVAANGLVFGSVNYGWAGFVNLQDAQDASGDWIEYYLDAMKQAESAAGKRLLDVLDLHWYPEARGNNVRITEADTSDAVAEARVQAPRSLWDPTYTETSWITQWSTQGPVRLIPRMMDKIKARYPDTKLAFTEYNYGAAHHISGGIAQADVLGIFAREGVFAAAYWSLGGEQDFVWGGFDMFRNYDGKGGAFGDIYVGSNTSDVAKSSVHASFDSSNQARVVIVAINRTPGPLTAAIALTHTVKLTHCQVWQLTSASSTPVKGSDIPITKTNAFTYPMPARSVSTLVLGI
jgi:hypothetical protein